MGGRASASVSGDFESGAGEREGRSFREVVELLWLGTVDFKRSEGVDASDTDCWGVPIRSSFTALAELRGPSPANINGEEREGRGFREVADLPWLGTVDFKTREGVDAPDSDCWGVPIRSSFITSVESRAPCPADIDEERLSVGVGSRSGCNFAGLSPGVEGDAAGSGSVSLAAELTVAMFSGKDCEDSAGACFDGEGKSPMKQSCTLKIS